MKSLDHQMEVATTPATPTSDPSGAGKAKKPYPRWRNKNIKKPYEKPEQKKDTPPKTGEKNLPLQIL